MFEVAEIMKHGWWNTRVRIVARQPMRREEKRMRSSWLRVATIDTWALNVEEGESFGISLPKSVPVKVGDTLSLDAIMYDAALRSRWSLIQRF